ncbi:MAG: hypothetical protein ABW022_11000 [Actinoplanes sp.]
MSEMTTGECKTCGQTFTWHQENKPVHPFNNGEAGATAFLNAGRDRDTRKRGNGSPRPAEDAPKVVWPTDPVLRIALIVSGVITADDLRKAEDMLKASMGLDGSRDGQSAEEARRGEVQVGTPAPVDVGQRPVSSEEMGAQPEDQQI